MPIPLSLYKSNSPIAKQIRHWEDTGKKWLGGNDITQWAVGDKVFKFNKKQLEFINAKDKFVHHSGGRGSGKTLALLLKLLMHSLFFPNNLILLGRKNLTLIEKITLPDFFDLCHPSWINHDKKRNILRFFNGSEIILFGLEALQEGAEADLKKAEQDLKSLNLGAVFIDQLEDIEERVYRTLRASLRRPNSLRQINSTANPANFWAYQFFKSNPQPNTHLIESSLYDNKENLPPDFIEDLLNNPDMWVRRYVYGEWTPDVLVESCVFDSSYIKNLEIFTREPIRVFDGISFYEEKNEDHHYQIGVDPSEGSSDPCHIVCVCKDTGRSVADFNGFISGEVIAKKALQIAEEFTTQQGQPKIVIEVNEAAGGAALEILKQSYENIYEREVFDYREKREMKKLGWKTNRSTKSILINRFLELLKEKYPKISDKRTIEEMKVFAYANEAKAEGAAAQHGYHDDRIMATMLAYYNLKKPNKEIDNLKEEIYRRSRKAIQKETNF